MRRSLHIFLLIVLIVLRFAFVCKFPHSRFNYVQYETIAIVPTISAHITKLSSSFRVCNSNLVQFGNYLIYSRSNKTHSNKTKTYQQEREILQG